jgi:hypothetical protein
MSKARVIFALALTLLLCSLASLATLQAETPKERLILKDGSYQVITQYKIVGNRVRYFSAERAEWEELPANMVDWQATQKWAKEHAPGASAASSSVTAAGAASASPADAEAAAIDKEEQAARAEQAALTPEVIPGLRLPDEMGVWVLDTFQAQPELVKLVQNSGNLNPRTGHNITHGTLGPGGELKQHIELPGDISKVQLHVDQPVFYVSLTVPDSGVEPLSEPLTVDTHGASMVNSKDSYSSPSSRYAIVRVQNNMRHDYRVLGGVSFSARMSQTGNVIPTVAQILPGKHWMKLTPSVPLTIGDYALMEILAPGEVNLSVWDFRVDPQGPDNMNAIMPLARSSQ